MLIDTHCHIHDRSCYNFALSRQQIGKKLLKSHPDYPRLPEDYIPDKIINRAHEAGVDKMICIGTSHENSLRARDFAIAHAKEGVYWSYGIHPDEASHYQVGENCIDSFTIAPVAIGEVGLDYSRSEANRKNQIKLFERMLQLAKDNNLPVIFHIREAFDDFFAITDNFPDIRGVVHSFSDNSKNLKKSLEKDFYIGVNGLATFAPELPIREIPLGRILLETDAPFLTPTPFRGTVNEPAHVKEICAYLSNITGESEASIAEITTKNAKQLFQI